MEKIKEIVGQWPSEGIFPERLHKFEFVRKHEESKEGFEIFAYEEKDTRWHIRAFYNRETKDFMVRISLYLLEFTPVDFIRVRFEDFSLLVETKLCPMIEKTIIRPKENFCFSFQESGLLDWNYDDILTSEAEGYKRGIVPQSAIKTLNGSYVIGTYYKESNDCGLVFFYNILRREFFAEYRVRHVPMVIHNFDATTTEGFEKAVLKNLKPALQELDKL